MGTVIVTELAVDSALEMDDEYRLGADDRRYIDDQILGCQQHLVDALINGRHGSWFNLSGGSAACAAGDVVCLASVSGYVTKAVSEPLALAPAAVGVVIHAASPGGKVFVAFGGILPPSITGLAASNAGYARVETSTGTIEQVSSISADDILIGVVDDAGWLQIQLLPVVISGEGGGGSGAGGDGKTVKAMADANQTLSSGDVTKGTIQTTGVLTARRNLTFPTPASAAASYQRVVVNSCTIFPIDCKTGSGTRTVAIPPGCTSIVEIDENGAKELTGKVYDPRDYGCPWDGIHDDLTGEGEKA